jgi:hypothetical protein
MTAQAPLSPIWRSLLVALVFGIILIATRAVALGDTGYYASDIVDHLGKSPFGPGNSLWEPGHLLWRPIGWALTSLLAPLLSATGWTPAMQASFALIVVSAASSLVTVVLWNALLIDVTRSATASFLITIAIACAHGVLLYAHSGCAYIPGLTCLTASVFLLRRNKLAAAASFYALATLLWLPYILAGAALLIIAACPSGWTASLREGLRLFSAARALRFVAISAACVLITYGLALSARRISSVGQARTWFSEANHGISQSGNGLRLATGLPRAFLYLGKDGILYRRYLRRDPYAHTTMNDLVRASLWKIAAFYLFAAAFAYELLRRTQSGWPLLLVLAGAGPVLYFAVFVFEPGQSERYLPAFPFLIVALGWILRDLWQRRRMTQIVIAGFLLCIVCGNGYSFAAPRVSREDRESLRRVAELRSHFTGTGVAVVVTNQDQIVDVLNRSAFEAINKPAPFPLYDAVEPATSRILTWREQFAAVASKVWDQGGEVWVSKRAWSERPEPPWNWVEGDNERIHWSEIPRFFSALQTDADEGGPDGFSRLAPNSGNRAILSPLASAYPEPASGPP